MTADALAVLCPTCSAPKGRGCTSFGASLPREPHMDRVTVAERAALRLGASSSAAPEQAP